MKRYIVAMLALCGAFYGKSENEIHKMTLQECINTGLQNNYALRIMRNEAGISKNNVTLGNAGYLPSIALESGYSGYARTNKQKMNDGVKNTAHPLNNSVDVGINLSQSLFEGFKIQAEYDRLKALAAQGDLQVRMQIENLISDIASDYYNHINQLIQLRNLLSAVKLSEERLRVVEAQYQIGSMSGLELKQARVDLNADKSRFIQQQENIYSSVIQLNRLMGIKQVEQRTGVNDTVIAINTMLDLEDLKSKMFQNNSELLLAKKQIHISEQDYKILKARNYPYVRLNAGYGYDFSTLSTASYDHQQILGVNYGVSMGISVFNGMNRRREQKNAKIVIENKELALEDQELQLCGELYQIYNAYQTQIRLFTLEKENLITAQDNYETAMDRYKLGDLSGIELREAQQSLLNAKERLLSAEYNTKLCEISLMLISGQVAQYAD